MSAVEPQGAQGAGLGRGLKAALIAALAVGVAAVLYVIGAALIKPNASAGGLQGVAKGGMAKLQVLAQPIAAASVPFTDATGKTVHLTDFKGQPVVLNLWATWCAPCVKEMPTLAKLQSDLAGKGVKVLAVSMDKTDQTAQAKAFIAGHAPLGFYQDADFAFLTNLDPHPVGFPTTVLIDRKGFERAIYSGDADWSGPDAKAVVERLAAE
jgi:thiol-disulfide isomerase/thioredoxin